MLFFNEDWTHYLWSRYEKKMPVNEETMREFIDQYQGTQITDFCMNVNGTVSTSASEVLETYAAKYLSKEENGIPVDYSDTYAKTAHELQQAGIDQYAVWTDELRKIGIRPWLSFRMNDCHGDYLPAEIRKSAYVDAHPEQWRVRHRETNGYFDKCLDFSLEEVRERMLAYIAEQTERYLPDGVELDFTREMYLVGIGAEYDSFELITGLVQAVRGILDAAEKKAGHEIRLGVLVGANISATFNQGFDIQAWCEKGLVDFVTILPRWQTINTNMDIGLWKKLISGKARLGAGLQLLVNPTGLKEGMMALGDHDFGQSVANLSLGADYIYLYNHFDINTSDVYEMIVEGSVRHPECMKNILHNIATIETAMRFKRRHILTYDDYNAPWENQNARLPLRVNQDFRAIRIAVGRLNEDAKVEFVAGFEEAIEVDRLTVYVNSRQAVFAREGGRYDGKGCSYTFSVPVAAIQTYALVELGYAGEAKLEFAEIIVE